MTTSGTDRKAHAHAQGGLRGASRLPKALRGLPENHLKRLIHKPEYDENQVLADPSLDALAREILRHWKGSGRLATIAADVRGTNFLEPHLAAFVLNQALEELRRVAFPVPPRQKGVRRPMASDKLPAKALAPEVRELLLNHGHFRDRDVEIDERLMSAAVAIARHDRSGRGAIGSYARGLQFGTELTPKEAAITLNIARGKALRSAGIEVAA